MSMQMYAIKCKEGYLKVARDSTFILCTIDKASVYKDVDTVTSTLKSLAIPEKSKLTNLRIAELTITENDFYQA